MNVILQLVGKFLRQFTACGREDYEQAATEVAIICISSFLPLLAGMGFFAITHLEGSVAKFGNSFMTSGEMFLIACALIGPLIYIITKKYGRFTPPLTLRFPYSTGFSLIIVLIWFFSGCVFVAVKATELLQIDILDADAMWRLSFWITIAAVLILYFATVFRNFMDRVDPGRLMHDEQEKFVQEFDDAGTN